MDVCVCVSVLEEAREAGRPDNQGLLHSRVGEASLCLLMMVSFFLF